MFFQYILNNHKYYKRVVMDDDDDIPCIIHGYNDLSITILDWDDTLFPTSWIDKAISNPYLYQDLQKIEQIVYKLFEKILDYCSIFYIVTNADSGWIEYSSSKYMPLVFNFLLLHQENVKIISARSNNSIMFPDQDYVWKLIEINNILSVLSQDSSLIYLDKQIISIGDSYIEKLATKEVASEYNLKVKTIKLLEQPSCKQLQQELELLYNNYDVIIREMNNIDILMIYEINSYMDSYLSDIDKKIDIKKEETNECK